MFHRGSFPSVQGSAASVAFLPVKIVVGGRAHPVCIRLPRCHSQALEGSGAEPINPESHSQPHRSCFLALRNNLNKIVARIKAAKGDIPASSSLTRFDEQASHNPVSISKTTKD